MYLPHYKITVAALLHAHHLTCGISSLHSVNLILFTVLLVQLILCISPHHSHHLLFLLFIYEDYTQQHCVSKTPTLKR